MSQNALSHKRRRGTAMLFYTMLLALVILPVCGLAIDVTMLFVVQSQLQTAVDGAASGALRLLNTSANTTEIAGEFLQANFPPHYWLSNAVVPGAISYTTTSSKNTVNVSATVTVPLLFLRIFRQDLANVGASSTATSWNLTPCALTYPYGSAPSLTSVAFNESSVLVAYGPAIVFPHGRVTAWYTDEHALTLGIRQVTVKNGKKTSATTNYPFTTFTGQLFAVGVNNGPLAVGTTALTGDQAGTDLATWTNQYGYLDHGRPFWPALYVTDITTNSSDTSGDWQQGGTSAYPPNAVYGTWKGAVRVYDTSTNPDTITVTVDSDPAQNHWNGIPDTPPGGFPKDQGWGAEVVWDVDSLGLVPGRTYRLQFMIHDGDQHSTGGDSGEGCAVASY